VRALQILIVVVFATLAACGREPAPQTDARHPEQAGQPLAPLRVAGHVVAAEALSLAPKRHDASLAAVIASCPQPRADRASG